MPQLIFLQVSTLPNRLVVNSGTTHGLTFAIQGAAQQLPPGLVLDSETGALSGTPTAVFLEAVITVHAQQHALMGQTTEEEEVCQNFSFDVSVEVCESSAESLYLSLIHI